MSVEENTQKNKQLSLFSYDFMKDSHLKCSQPGVQQYFTDSLDIPRVPTPQPNTNGLSEIESVSHVLSINNS